MESEKFIARNELERVLLQAKSGKLSMQEALVSLANSTLSIPSITKVLSDGTDFQPLLFDKRGQLMVAAFTDKTRLGQHAQSAKYSVDMQAAKFLERIPSGYGIVINPGSDLGLDLTPEGIESVLALIRAPSP